MELIRWMNLSGGYGDAGMRPERRLSGRNGSERREPLRKPGCHSGANAINPRGLGTESPSFRKFFFFRFGGEVVNHRSVEHSWMSHFTPSSIHPND